MFENILSEVFAEIGLSSFDLEVYTKILNSKNLSVTALGKNMHSSRSKIYQSLHILHQHEIILFQPFAKNKILPLNPQSILTKLKYRSNKIKNLTQKFETIIPEIKGEYNFGSNKSITEYTGFSDLFLLLHQITDIIPVGGEYLWFNETSELSYFFRDFFFGEYSIQRAKKNIKARILAHPLNTVLKQHIQSQDPELRFVKYLPQIFEESSTFTIFEDSVIFWNIPQLKAYLIKDIMLAKTQKSVFESYWSKKDPA
jgi:sugar-specific transcriptional regulator TrmB